MKLKGHRYFTLSCLFGIGAFVLAWRLHDAGSFADVAMVALAGGHATNAIERYRGGAVRPPEDIP